MLNNRVSGGFPERQYQDIYRLAKKWEVSIPFTVHYLVVEGLRPYLNKGEGQETQG